jgi:flagella basal body P-ring formation protein FlgA
MFALLNYNRVMKNSFFNSQFSILNFPFILFFFAASLPLCAAEIKMKSVPCRCTTSLVMLTDVADIIPAADDHLEQLRETVLFPAPMSGEQRVVTQSELRNILSHLGLNSTRHQLTGAAKITVLGSEMNLERETNHEKFVVQASYTVPISNHLTPKGTNEVHTGVVPAVTPIPSSQVAAEWIKTLETQLAEALVVYLNYLNGNTHQTDRPWEITVKLSPEQAQILATGGQIVEIVGGNAPFTGPQQFQIRMQNNTAVTVHANVVLPQMVVVLRRSLPKGYIITSSDVMLKGVDKIRGDEFFIHLKDVIGKETVKAIGEMNALTPSMLRLPVLVRKGEIVTVRAAGGGITVRTEATAMQDGVLGDTISVARIDASAAVKKGKKTKEEPVTYLARVCSAKTVEVFPSGIRIEN